MSATATDPPMSVPDKAIDRLFHGPLEEFTAQRNELAKSLRSEGEAEAADWVKGLAKPTRAAWLVNQLSVRKSKEIDRLLEIGARLRTAQEEMLAGATERDDLRAAARREQEAIDSLLGTTEAIGREHGVGQQILTRVGETLQAAASDPELAEAIRLGRLAKEQRAASIGLVGPAAPVAAKSKGKDRDSAEGRARRQRAERRNRADRKLAAAEKRLERERAALARAREAVEKAEAKVDKAELDASAARRALEEI